MDMLSVVSVICVNVTYDSTYNYIESLEQVRVSIIIAMKPVGNAPIKSKFQPLGGFEALNIGSFEFPPTLSSGFSVKCPS